MLSSKSIFRHYMKFTMLFVCLQFSGLYLLSFIIIILGLVLYYSSSTYVAQDPRVYKQFRNVGNAITDTPTVGPLEPSVTYTSLGQEIEEEPHVRVAWRGRGLSKPIIHCPAQQSVEKRMIMITEWCNQPRSKWVHCDHELSIGSSDFCISEISDPSCIEMISPHCLFPLGKLSV